MALRSSYCVPHSSASRTCGNSSLCGRDQTQQPVATCCQCVVYAHNLRVVWAGAVWSNADVSHGRRICKSVFTHTCSFCPYSPLLGVTTFSSLWFSIYDSSESYAYAVLGFLWLVRCFRIVAFQFRESHFSPRAATPPRHVAVATKRKQRYHVTGREDRHAPPNRVTRHHRHGLHAPRPSRRARRGALRGDPGLCRSHQTTKSCKSGYLLEV